MRPTGIARTPADSVDPQRYALRSDARHNRERILAAAREALAVSNDASLNSIANKAAVGPGTLYRHFPSREALVLAVYQEDVRALTDSAADLLTQHPPLRALRLWFDRLATYGNQGLAGALQSAATSHGLTDETYRPVVDAVRLLLLACQQEGSVRPDIKPDDVLLLLGFLWRTAPGEDAATRAARLLDLVISGLQAGAPGSRTSRRPARSSIRLRRRLSLASIRTPRSL